MPEPTPTNGQRAWPLQAIAPVARSKSIVCGTDFSKQAREAVEVAGALAKRLDERLVLVHAVDEAPRTTLPTDLRESLCLYERAELHKELERLREANVQVTDVFRAGKPEKVLVETATVEQGRLLVVSSHGRKPPGRWMLGSVAEGTAEASAVPTLIVRAARPLTEWTLGRRSLRVFVAADFSIPSEAALRWVQWLREVGTCEVVIACLDPAIPTLDPLNIYPSRALTEMLVKAERTQARSFRQRVRALLGGSGVRVRIEKGWARSDAHLIEMAREERADLLVVGTHQWHGLRRLSQFSVSRGILHYAPMSVACVPVPAGAPVEQL